jgi:hypothetical protein
MMALVLLLILLKIKARPAWLLLIAILNSDPDNDQSKDNADDAKTGGILIHCAQVLVTLPKMI